MKIFFFTIILLTIAFCFACKSKDKCDCSHKNVCVTIINATGQSVEKISLGHCYNYTNCITSPSLANGETTCLSYENSGEDEFRLTAVVNKNDTIESHPYYTEGGFIFIATLTKDSIKIKQKFYEFF